ncbi:hypothetical protein BGX34_000453 [Mortierella sp. NVP85]|nr:hypothetical protein BGX34_000453 [Mortierella sp. NVP85]
MANKLRTRQGTAGATATATAQATAKTRAEQNSSNEKAKAVLTRKSSRINKTDDAQDRKDENTVKVKKTEKSLKRRKDVTFDGSEAEDTEKENVPPKTSHLANGQLGTRIEAESNKDLVQAPVAKKKKWSRPTREIKLEDPEEEEVADNETSSQDGSEDVASTKEDSDGDYKDEESGSRNKREQKVVAKAKPRRVQEAEMSEYERQRLENIRRNQEILLLLELPTAATEMQVASLEGKQPEEIKKSETENTSEPVRIRRQYTKPGENDTVEKNDTQKDDDNTEDEKVDDVEDTTNLMSGDLFFDKETRDKAIRVDGCYKGWINSEVMKRHGFEKSAQEAWEANGGGTFSFKDPLGTSEEAGTSRSKSSRRPRYDAKLVSKALFKKNPNAYFYRHNEPGQAQWTGDWTPEEGKLFLEVAREFGCGDKWGLFASHIPHRVGYQCSNYYRQIVLPQGLVFDPNYEYTSRGKPIYCGKYNQQRS